MFVQCNGVRCIHVECTECNRLNGMHVKDVKDILYAM